MELPSKVRINIMKKRIQFFAAMLLALLVSNCTHQDDVVVLRMGHTLDQQHAVHKAMVFMAERLEFYSKGSMQLRVYSGGQLGSERELIELLQIGSLAMTKVSASPLEGFSPRMKIFSVPYVFRDSTHLWQVLDSDIGQQLLNDLTKVRLRGLGYYDAGSRSFYTTQKQINTPADLAGLKFRVPNSQTCCHHGTNSWEGQQRQSIGASSIPRCSKGSLTAPRIIHPVFIYPAITK